MCAFGWNGAEKEKQSRKDIVRREQLHYNKKQICNMRRDEQMQKKNYQKELDKKIEQIVSEKKVPRLFLHSCCAPCSSYVLEYLSEYFEITVFYYNPNIFPESEFEKRIHEQKKLIRELPAKHTIHFRAGSYEGGERCFRGYELRLREAARFAKEGRYDYFTTTLSISPLKNAQKLNEIGERLAGEYGVAYLVSDFKKRNGYKRSTELSKIYGLYRQDYCGCIYSKNQREREKKLREEEESSVKS